MKAMITSTTIATNTQTTTIGTVNVNKVISIIYPLKLRYQMQVHFETSLKHLLYSIQLDTIVPLYQFSRKRLSKVSLTICNACCGNMEEELHRDIPVVYELSFELCSFILVLCESFCVELNSFKRLFFNPYQGLF